MRPVRVAAVAALLVAVLTLPAAAAAPDERRITVVGSASVRVAPDVAEWSFAVRTEGATARAALRANSARMRGVLAAIRAAGIARRNIRTEYVSLYPKMNEEGGQALGYVASNTVHVTVRSLGRSARVIDAAVRAGANEVYGPALGSSQREALYEQALERAYDDARAKAQALAAKTGMTLGQVLAVREGAEEPVAYEGAVAHAALDSVPIEPGQSEIPAVLTVTFAAS